MKDHLHGAADVALDSLSSKTAHGRNERPCPEFSLVFRELFSVAASELAHQIHQPLEDLGHLFEEPVNTGCHSQNPGWSGLKTKISQSLIDLEKGSLLPLGGKGKFLFVIRRLSGLEVAHLGAAGFRFALDSRVSAALSKSMEMPKDELETRLTQMRARICGESTSFSGVHLAYFELRPRPHQGFDVMVSAGKSDQLPVVKMPYEQLLPWQVEILDRLDDWTVAQVMNWLQNDSGSSSGLKMEFNKNLRLALDQLITRLQGGSVMQARLSARVLDAPCQPDGKASSQQKSSLITIHLMSTIHTPCPADFVFVPLRSFIIQQQVVVGSADREAFRQQAKIEFAHCNKMRRKGRQSSRHSSRVVLFSSRPSSLDGGSSTRKSIHEANDDSEILHTSKEMPVRSPPKAVSVKRLCLDDWDCPISSDNEDKQQNKEEKQQARDLHSETETFVDRLCAVCVESRPMNVDDVLNRQ